MGESRYQTGPQRGNKPQAPPQEPVRPRGLVCRPHYCIDPGRCEVLWSNYTTETFDRGESINCYGRMAEQHVFVAGETTHKNDLSRCLYTPLKGVIRYLECKADLEIDVIANNKVLDTIDPQECDECGYVARDDQKVLKFQDGARLCLQCGVRLGRLVWHPEANRYW